MQRMMTPALSEMTAFWKEIPCNPSTRTWERDDGGTPGMKEKTFCCRIRSDFVRQGRWRLAGSSSRRKWGAGAQRRLCPAAAAQAARLKSSAGRCGRQGGGRRGRGSTAQATGREEPRGPTALGSALSQTPCDGQKGSRATRDQSRQRGQETAASEEEKRHRGRPPRKATPVFRTLNTAEWLLSLSKGLFTP